MVNISNPVKPEWTMAIYDVVRILTARGYLHRPSDIVFVRPSHEPVLPCGEDSSDGPIDFKQLKWAAEKGEFWFCWYKGSFLQLHINKGTLSQKLTLDPTKQNVWEFVREVDSTFR